MCSMDMSEWMESFSLCASVCVCFHRLDKIGTCLSHAYNTLIQCYKNDSKKSGSLRKVLVRTKEVL